MINQWFILGCVAFCSSLNAAPFLIGDVYHQKTGKYLYTERYSKTGATWQVSYQQADLPPFASKQLDFTSSLYQPDVIFNSRYCGESYRIKQDKRLNVHYENRCDKTKKNQSLRIKEPFVIDAGFSDYLAQYPTNKQKSVTFYYPLPTQARWIKMKATHLPCQKARKAIRGLQRHQLTANRCIKLTPDNFFIAQLFPPIYLGYEDQSLRFFAGRSNMSNRKGQYDDIAIHYHTTGKPK